MGTAVADLPAGALELRETITLSESALNADGTITLDLIRPCVGKGKGTHLYEADMLRENAKVFEGWKMYVDHLSDQARKQLGGLPRSVRDLGGRITESWWDPSVPADPARGFGQGAVRGKAKPSPFIHDLVESDPEIVALSINGNATGVKPAIRDGRRVLLVEGIRPDGSVDWVTEAGAGGKVVSLMEAAYSDENQEAALLESLTDGELHEYLSTQRPALASLLKGGGEGGGDGTDAGAGTDADNNDNGGDGAGEGVSESSTNDQGGDDDVTITPEALREALSTDEGKAVLLDVIREGATELLAPLVEAAVADERDLTQAAANAHASRQIEVRDMRDRAVKLIEAAKLPESFAKQSVERFALTEDGPTPALDVIPEVDADGNIVKTAMDVLTEAVNTEIASQRALLATVSKTKVIGQGASGDGGGGDGEGASTVGPITESLLREAGFSDPDKVYASTGA